MSDGRIHPGYRVGYNVNPDLVAGNVTDEDGNPTGGSVRLDIDVPGNDGQEFPALFVRWQNGPRGRNDSSDSTNTELDAPNGAFVEDVIWAALQRLEFFNEGKYRSRQNSIAITHLEQALQALNDRTMERSYRGVEGKHEV